MSGSELFMGMKDQNDTPGVGVSEPNIVVENVFLKHVEYKITSPKSKPENGPIVRRYKHFLWLNDRFLIERPGSIMPPLPAKQKGRGRFAEEFIEDRRECLEIFLNAALLNPELKSSPSLDIFLHCSNIIFGQLIATKDEEVMAAMLGTFSSEPVTENKTVKLRSVSKRVAAKGILLKKGMADLVKSDDDEIFEQAEKTVPVFLREIKRLSREAADLMYRAQNSSQDYCAIGKSFEKISEVEEGDLALSCEKMGLIAAEQSALATKHADDIRRTFVRPINMFIGTVIGINTALAARNALREELTFFINQLNMREKRQGRQNERLAAAEQAVAQTADEVVEDANAETEEVAATIDPEMAARAKEKAAARADAAKARQDKLNALVFEKNEEVQLLREEYDNMSKRLLRELERFNGEKVILMNAIIEGFTTLEAKCNAEMQSNWSSLGQKLSTAEKEAVKETEEVVEKIAEKPAPVKAA